MRLVAKLMNQYNDSSPSAKILVDEIKGDLDKVYASKTDDPSYVSRIANHFPDYFTDALSKLWVARTEKLFKNLKLESLVPDKSVEAILKDLNDDYDGAYEYVKLSSKCEEEVRSIYRDMLRESCRQTLMINGNIDPQLVSLLGIHTVMADWKEHEGEFKSLFVGSVCNNILVPRLFQDLQFIIDNENDGRSDNESSIKKILVVNMINDTVKNKLFIRNEIINIIHERFDFDCYLHSYLSSGEYDVDLGKKLLVNIDNIESKLNGAHQLFGLFSRLIRKDEERLLEYAGHHYPEMADEVAELVLPLAAFGEHEFSRAVKMLMHLDRHDLVCQALYPNNTSGEMLTDIIPRDVNDDVIHHAYLVNYRKHQNHKA